jgi:hypothetical protein
MCEELLEFKQAIKVLCHIIACGVLGVGGWGLGCVSDRVRVGTLELWNVGLPGKKKTL